MKQPVIITGCPRSGTGIIAGLLRLCGAFGGTKLQNHGSKRITSLVADYLSEQGADPGGQFPLPDTDGLYLPYDWRTRVQDIIEGEGYDGGVWYIKSSQAALMWPVWKVSFPDAKWVIVRRRTGDIVDSCVKTAHMKAFKDEENRQRVEAETEKQGWIWMARQYEQRFYEMITAGLDVKVMWPQRMVWGDFQQVHQLLGWTGLRWQSEVLGFVDQKLEKTRIKESAL